MWPPLRGLLCSSWPSHAVWAYTSVCVDSYSRYIYAHTFIFHSCPQGQALSVLMLLHSHLSSPPYPNIYSTNTVSLHTSTIISTMMISVCSLVVIQCSDSYWVQLFTHAYALTNNIINMIIIRHFSVAKKHE